ncbi:DUF7373 family lipoprotein [Mycolicibacterium sp. XJ1819]
MRRALLALVIAVMLPLAACTSVVDGTPTKPVGAAAVIDFDQLDVGPYPTSPREPLGVAGNARAGRILEAQRMANHVVGPWEVDSALTESFGFGALALPAPEAMLLIGPVQLGAVAARHNFINGFASARTQKNKKLLMNAVLRFPDDATAKSAATAFGETAMRQRGADGPAQETEIPGHAEARASAYTATDRTAGKFFAARSFIAHGPYVLMQQAQSTDRPETATELIAKTIDLQGPMIGDFRATDPAEFSDISIDPTGLLARTIPMDGREATVTQNTTYERQGALHFQSDPARSAKLFSATGTDVVAMARTNVYEADDAEAALDIVEEFNAEVEPDATPATPVRNMPDSRCLRLQEGGFYCLVTADRYAVETSAPTLLGAQQLAAAQYVMLMS